MNKALFFCFTTFIAAIIAQPVFSAGSCSSALSKAKSKCTQTEDEKAVDTSNCNNDSGFGMGADTSSCITSAGKAINAAFASRCSSPAEDCVNACAKESKNLATCKELKKRADDAKTQSGGDDQANKDANKSGQQSGTGGMPQMPQQQQDQSSPSPSPSTFTTNF